MLQTMLLIVERRWHNVMKWDSVKQYTYELQLCNVKMYWVLLDYQTVGDYYLNELYYNSNSVPNWVIDDRNRLSHDVMDIEEPEILPYIQFIKDNEESPCQILAWYPLGIETNTTELLEHLSQVYHATGCVIVSE